MKKRFSEEQIIGFLKETEAGVPVKELCRTDYNEYRPHSMLGYKTPAEVAEKLRT